VLGRSITHDYMSLIDWKLQNIRWKACQLFESFMHKNCHRFINII